MSLLLGATLTNSLGEERYIASESIHSLTMFGIVDGAYFDNGKLKPFKNVETLYLEVFENEVDDSHHLKTDNGLETITTHFKSGKDQEYKLTWENITESEHYNPSQKISYDSTGLIRVIVGK